MRFRRHTPVVEAEPVDLPEEASPPSPSLGCGLRAAGVLLVLLLLPLAVRLVYEQTWLTWSEGLRSERFLLLEPDEGGGAGVPGVIAVVLGLTWLIVAGVPVLARLLRGRRPASFDLTLGTLLAVAVAFCAVPYPAWRALSFAVAGPGPHGPAHLTYAAAAGEALVVRTLVLRGSALDEPGPGGRTPLTAAVESGDRETVGALLEAGADPERADAHGRTPQVRAYQLGRGLWLASLLEAQPGR